MFISSDPNTRGSVKDEKTPAAASAPMMVTQEAAWPLRQLNDHSIRIL